MLRTFQIALSILVIGVTASGAAVRPQLVSTLEGALMIAPDGSLWAWGGSHGPIPTWFGDRRFSEVPVRIGPDHDWSKVSAKFWTLLALKLDGSLWGWGWQYAKRPGSADVLTYVANPTRIGSSGGWCEITVGAGHCLGLKNDGSLWTWGQNDYGQLGDATTNSRATPMRLGSGSDWKAIAAGAFTSFALKRDGTIWAWGNGLEQTHASLSASFIPGDHLFPYQLDTGTNWSAMVAGDFFLLALKSDGTLWIGGENARSVCSDCLEREPGGGLSRVGERADWAEIYAGGGSFFARKKNGRWFACGYNPAQQLGLGKEGVVTSLERLFLDVDCWAFATGSENTLLLAKNGALLTWGKRLGSDQSRTTITVKENVNTLLKRLSQRLTLFDTERFKIDGAPVQLWDLPANARR